MKTVSFMILILLVGVPCLAQNSDQPNKQEIVALAHKADEAVTLFEQANKSADPFIPDSAVKKGVDAASKAHQLVGDITKNGPSAYAWPLVHCAFCGQSRQRFRVATYTCVRFMALMPT